MGLMEILSIIAMIAQFVQQSKQQKQQEQQQAEAAKVGETEGGLYSYGSHGGMNFMSTLDPQQRSLYNILMNQMQPTIGLPGQAFGQSPTGTWEQNFRNTSNLMR